MKRGVAKILLDVRRGDGPPAARHFTFPALITTERLVEEQPNVAAAAVRAIVKTQKALKADPQLAAKAAQRLFPAEELSLIAYEIARDAPFYDPTITAEMVEHISRFAREVGTLDGEVRYDQVVDAVRPSVAGLDYSSSATVATRSPAATVDKVVVRTKRPSAGDSTCSTSSP